MSLTFVHHREVCHSSLSPTSRRNVLQVSRRAGARTRANKGPTKKVNLLQMPGFLEFNTHPVQLEARMHSNSQQPSEAEVNSADSLDGAHTDSDNLVYDAPALTPSLVSAPRVPVKWVQLSVLARPNLAEILIKRAAALEAKPDPKRWLQLGRLTNHHVLAALLQHYGQCEYLDLAIECVGARIQYCLLEVSSRMISLREIRQKYLSVLQSLQVTLASASDFDWRMWQTTLLLNLFELLDEGGRREYVYHAQGASCILAALGPHSIQTESQRQLLISQAEIMILDNIIANKKCFLCKPDWQTAIQSTISTGSQLGPRSAMAVKLCMFSTGAPGLFQKVTNAVVHRSFEEMHIVVEDLCVLLRKYIGWAAEWDTIANEGGAEKILECHPTFKTAIIAKYLAYFAMCNRLLVAVSPSFWPAAEHNALRAAAKVMRLTDHRSSPSVDGLGIVLARTVAQSVLTTMSQWCDPEAYVSGTIESYIFCDWCTLLGRAT